jgi:hypothetical protein
MRELLTGLYQLRPHRTPWRTGRPRFVALNRHAHPFVLPITKEERAVARDILHRPPVAAPSIRLCLHHGPQVRLRTQRLRLDHLTEPVTNHKPSRLRDRPQRIRLPSSSHAHSMPQLPSSSANPTDDPCTPATTAHLRSDPIARFPKRL